MKNNKMMYQELAQDKIEPLKAALGAKTSKALVYFITRKLEHPEEKINDMASDCQEYMEKVIAGYMRRNGEDFLNEMEIDLEDHLFGNMIFQKRFSTMDILWQILLRCIQKKFLRNYLRIH